MHFKYSINDVLVGQFTSTILVSTKQFSFIFALCLEAVANTRMHDLRRSHQPSSRSALIQAQRSFKTDSVTAKRPLTCNTTSTFAQSIPRAPISNTTPPLTLLSKWTNKWPHLLLLPAPKNTRSIHTAKPTDLPDEVLLTIFQYLPRVRDIAAVRGVCRTWRSLVDHTAAIWRSIVFDLPQRPTSVYLAESWYRKAADFGNVQAQVSLFYFSSTCVVHNLSMILGRLYSKFWS